jgi:hypothetical protein
MSGDRTITGNTPFSDIASVVYVEVDATGFVEGDPESAKCSFSPIPTVPVTFPDNCPANIAALYATASGPLPLTTPQDGLDITLAEWGFVSGQYAAIAFNLSPNTDGTYNYVFKGVSGGSFDPTQALQDGEPLPSPCSLTWIQGDTFDSTGQTVIVMCPVTAPDSNSEVPYTLQVMKTSIGSGASTLLVIDPHVRNGGYG